MSATPHGGVLVERVLAGEERTAALGQSKGWPAIDLLERQAREVENIALGVYSPLTGFMTADELTAVLSRSRLPGGAPWTIPIVLDVSEADAARLGRHSSALLRFEGKPLAVLRRTDEHRLDQDAFARQVFGTEDAVHPGVAFTGTMRPILLGGTVDLIELAATAFPRHRLWPRQTRALFDARGWRTIVGFQTRNIPHLGHEGLQKAALNLTDGLFISPLVGGKKAGDFEDPVIVAAYDALLAHYYPEQRAALGILQGQMRYAGPREAIFHAIQRQNFGCTHFIIGRDHAGVGNFYPPFAAQEIFGEFPDLGIVPLFFPAFFSCRRCGGLANEKTCPHGPEARIDFSGTRLRKALVEGEEVDAVVRPEVMAAIRAAGSGTFRV